jgi:hypothetical protein
MEQSFRTVVPVKQLPILLEHRTSCISIGSCFAEHIGSRLAAFCFPVICNPSGILFNPLSIELLLRRLLDRRLFSVEDLVFHDGRWHGFEHHSDFSGSDRDRVLGAMNTSFVRAADALARAGFLLLTFGTAALYRHVPSGRLVANCHKIPAAAFERRLATAEEIVAVYKTFIAGLLSRRPHLKILLTVSPVRHLRDDPRENSVSKARLIDASFALEAHFKEVSYFPAWEIMMDELRDYRFYTEDMAHPNETAIAYIWERFCEGCIAPRSREFMRAYEPIVKAMRHQVTDRGSAATREFATGNLAYLQELRRAWLEIDLRPALDYFTALME